MWDSIVKILLTIAVAGLIIGLLPESPFALMIADIETNETFNNAMGVLNWAFPIHKCFVALTVWATCMGVYYGIAWILRQLNIVSE